MIYIVFELSIVENFKIIIQFWIQRSSLRFFPWYILYILFMYEIMKLNQMNQNEIF